MKNIRILIRNGIGMHPLKKAEKVNAINKRYQYEDIRKDKRCYLVGGVAKCDIPIPLVIISVNRYKKTERRKKNTRK